MKHSLPFIILSFVLLLLASCTEKSEAREEQSKAKTSLTAAQKEGLSEAVFASGCFWCSEAIFERLKGVEEVVSAYAGGTKPNPTYKEVSAGRTKYAEAIKVYYRPEEISYQQLLEVFFATHDPTQLNRQGPDVGRQYRSAIFFETPAQKKQAEDMISELKASGKYAKPIVTTLEPLDNYYQAEDYHQDYYRLHPEDPYVQKVSKPKVEKFEKEFQHMLKNEFKTETTP